jgi:tyrosine-protein kinase Etk/Wzc
VDEARDSIIIQVLDKAQPPVKKSKPKRALIMFIATFTGFFISIFIAFFTEHMKGLYAEEKNEKLKELIRKHSSFYRKDNNSN